MSISGGCHCGAVRYKGNAAPGFSFICQCRACQFDSGTGHGAGFVFPQEAFTLTGALSSWTRDTDSGNTVTTYRCTNCGTQIYNDPTRVPDSIMITAASLDDPASFAPQTILNQDSAHPWDTIFIADGVSS